jgi:perosamine synthetase
MHDILQNQPFWRKRIPMIKNVTFAKPSFDDNDLEEIASKIKDVLRSGWLTSGPNTQEFEKQFGSYVGAQYSVAVNSCTAALHSILLALGIKQGDEVIVPSDTFVASANVALYVGAKPVLVDSDRDTFNISPEDIQKKITKKTKAIIVVHLGGNPCDMKEINEIAQDHKVTVIEDAAHAHGSKHGDTYCGTLGFAAAFSFYPTKVMTCGEGGMVTTNDSGLADKVKMIRNHGRASYGPAEIVELGFNFRMTDVHAVIGLSQLKHLSEYVERRNTLANLYAKELEKIDWIKPQKVRDGNLSSYYVYNVRLEEDAPLTRDELATRLNQKGVGTSILYHPIHSQPLYSKLYKGSKAFPVAQELGERTIALPMHNSLSTDEVKYVVAAISQVAEGS